MSRGPSASCRRISKSAFATSPPMKRDRNENRAGPLSEFADRPELRLRAPGRRVAPRDPSGRLFPRQQPGDLQRQRRRLGILRRQPAVDGGGASGPGEGRSRPRSQDRGDRELLAVPLERRPAGRPGQGPAARGPEVDHSQSDERRVGKEGVSKCRYRLSPYHKKKNQVMNTYKHRKFSNTMS